MDAIGSARSKSDIPGRFIDSRAYLNVRTDDGSTALFAPPANGRLDRHA